MGLIRRVGEGLALLGCCAALAFVSAPTSASPAAAAPLHAGKLVGGPALVGGKVAWAQRSKHVLTVRAAEPGARPQTLGSFTSDSAFAPRARMAASPTYVAVERILGDHSSDWHFRDVFAGPSGGPLAALGPQCSLLGARLMPTVDVSGDEVVYWDCGTDRATVRNSSSGASEAIPANDRGLRLAGRYAAWLDDGAGPQAIVVYDRVENRVAYEVSRSAVDASYDLQADGKIAYVDLAGQAREGVTPVHVAWASPAEPQPHVLPLAPSDSYRVKIVDDRVGFEQERPEARRGELTNLGYVDIAGGRPHAVVTGGLDEGVGDSQFDFDGKRFAWYSLGCRDALLRVTAVGSHASGLRRHCPLRLRRPPRLSHGRVRVVVDCFGFVECRVPKLTLSLVRHGHRVVARGSGQSARLTTLGRALARRHAGIRVRVRATIVDAEGRREQRSTRVLLGG
jgi:hypothetical protein